MMDATQDAILFDGEQLNKHLINKSLTSVNDTDSPMGPLQQKTMTISITSVDTSDPKTPVASRTREHENMIIVKNMH